MMDDYIKARYQSPKRERGRQVNLHLPTDLYELVKAKSLEMKKETGYDITVNDVVRAALAKHVGYEWKKVE